MESLVIWYQNSLGSFMPKEVFIFLVSMLPLIELRGGLIIASLLKVPLVQANIICIIGNIIPIPFILLFIKKIFELDVYKRQERISPRNCLHMDISVEMVFVTQQK